MIVMSLNHKLNEKYLKLHIAKEKAFWAMYMNLKEFIPRDFAKTENILKAYISDTSILKEIRKELEKNDLSDEERIGLLGWKKYFEIHAIENEEAKALAQKIVKMEEKLGQTRQEMKLGYIDPKTGEFIEASSTKLYLMITSEKDESVRRAVYESLCSIETFLLKNGFINIIKERNRLARMLGYEDYYDYRAFIFGDMSKKQLFSILDDFEKNTRSACQIVANELKSKHGENAVKPWNYKFYSEGYLNAQLDPYFPLEQALIRFGKTFMAMGIDFKNALLQLDLVERKGKSPARFMHIPFPPYIENGEFKPAWINIASTAIPGTIGSGKDTLIVLLHEGGHSAHTSNITMPSPCFSQEFPPTSPSFAETQSMFIDQLINDADWLSLYAANEQGEPIPWELIKENLENQHRDLIFASRRILTTSIIEKYLYELSDGDLTADKILPTIRKIEADILTEPSYFPTLSIPHLITGDFSAYYHSYLLGLLGVYQTRTYFLKKYGYIIDNPKIGEELRKEYWEQGNLKSFTEYIKDLTGEEFSANAFIDQINKSIEEIYYEAEKSIEKLKEIPEYKDPIDLQADIRIVHGDNIIVSLKDDVNFEAMAEKYANWIKSIKKED